MSGDNCGKGALTAGVGKLISANAPGANVNNIVVGAARSATIGGTLSVLGGGKFSNGAMMGAFQYLYNQARTQAESFRSMFRATFGYALFPEVSDQQALREIRSSLASYAKETALDVGVGGARLVSGIADVGTLIALAHGNVPLALTCDRVSVGASLFEFALTSDFSKPTGVVAGAAMQRVVGEGTRYGVAAGFVYGKAVEYTSESFFKNDKSNFGR